MKHFSALVAFTFLLSITTFAQLHPQVDSIPMSDGRKLAADVYIPVGMSQGPVILIQTPYNRLLFRGALPLQIGQNLDSSKYIFVIADWRGFYGSTAAAHVGAPSLGDDGYSAVEWIAQQAWSNGKIGTWGASALGRVQFQTAAKNPPHLVCICPLVAAPQYSYQEYCPNGVLRTEYVDQLNTLGFGLETVIMAHQVQDAFWNYWESSTFFPDSINVPCYMMGGWYDHTIDQMMPFFSALQTQSPSVARSQHRLLMGPWVHKGVGDATQGQLSYPDAQHWSDSLALMYFDYHLRNVANGFNQTPVVQYFQMGDNTWYSSSAWPPTGTVNTNFNLLADGTLGVAYPILNNDSLTYQYDPTDPSPTVGGPTLRNDLNEGPYNQAPAVESRNDILTFSTPVLQQNATMKGNAVVHLKVASNRFDTDFDVRITDVYPDGRSMLVNDGAVRMRSINGVAATDTAAIIPGQIYDATITLPATAITFLTGHKIRVDISSSNYPRFNRNMNTDGPQYPNKNIDTLVNPLVATNTVYTSPTHSSYVTLPLVDYSGMEENVAAGNINIYPNPASHWLNVQLPADVVSNSITVYDILGNEILSQAQSKGVAQATIDISSLGNGLYIVKSGAKAFGKFEVVK